MVNKIKRFFKSLGGKPASSSSTAQPSAYMSVPSADPTPFVSGPYGSSSAVAFHASTSTNLSAAELESRLETSGSLTGATSSSTIAVNSADYTRDGFVDWGALLAKVPKLVAECTTCTSSGSDSSAPRSKSTDSSGLRDMQTLLGLLQQMAGRENQQQISHFYHGSDTTFGSNASHSQHYWNHRRKLFRQCRRSLLMCWKFLVAQLNDKKAALAVDTRNMYFQLVGLIMERVEFHLPINSAEDSQSIDGSSNNATPNKMNTPKQQPAASAAGMGWLAHSPPSSAKAMELGEDTRSNSSSSFVSDPENANSNVSGSQHKDGSKGSSADDGVDGERDMYLYRCLLVATFKYVVENLEAARLKRRPYVSLVETQFYARVLAVCFFRVPLLQAAMLDQIFRAYRAKRWVNIQAHESRVEDAETASGSSSSSAKPPGRRHSSSRPWNGNTFAGSLLRWTDYEGYALGEEDDGESGTKSYSSSRFKSAYPPAASAAGSASSYVPSLRGDEEEFRTRNPTLFKWTRFSPYLGPYTDTDIFRMTDSTRSCWLEKLSHDGEFFSKFMGFLCLHAANTALNGEIIWTSLPGYTLLIRVSLLLLKEACWAKWLYVRDTSGPLPSSSMEIDPGSQEEERLPFELNSIRAIRTVLDNVVQILRNGQLLESCVLAMYECTNVLHARSVEVCLTRFEEWFSATAVPIQLGGSASTRGRRGGSEGMTVYRLPPGFRGQTFSTGMRFMLSSENCEILGSTLLFLYNRMDYFEGELRQNILKAIVQRHMGLFLHWNADVRTKYHHLLVYRVVRVNRFVLDSIMDHLLIGRCAISTLELSRVNDEEYDEDEDEDDEDSPQHRDRHYHDDRYHNSFEHPSNPSMSAADLGIMRTEQALWRAFDACLGVIVSQERRFAREGNRHFQNNQLAARCRAQAFRKLNRRTTEDSAAAATTSVNEGLPGGKPCKEVELLDFELRREPPYYLRYLPTEELASLEELRRLASSVKYSPELRVYAAHSLRCYSDLLKQYYRELDSNGSVEPPALGYF